MSSVSEIHVLHLREIAKYFTNLQLDATKQFLLDLADILDKEFTDGT